MKTIQQWFDEYGESHQNKTNKTIHWICVPSIFFSVVALLYIKKFIFTMDNINPIEFSLAHVVLFAAMIFYIRLSWRLSISTLLFAMLCIFICAKIEAANISLLYFALSVFILAWIGQFIGHKIEGKKPSFLKDIQFLLIGPIWLLGFIYKKLGINY